MPLTGHVLAAFCACCLGLAEPSRARPDTLRVQVKVEYDRSIAPNVLKAVFKEEATAIWKVYGVELLWSDSRVGVAQRLDVIVGRNQTDAALVQSPSVLGHTTIDRSWVVRGSIGISFDAVSALLDERQGADPALHEVELARALGRVLAHEIGHVLLGPPSYHDSSGLMRATYVVDDLARLDRHRFRLTDASARRLRARIVGSLGVQPDRCVMGDHQESR
jgi:hypothetical protein